MIILSFGTMFFTYAFLVAYGELLCRAWFMIMTEALIRTAIVIVNYPNFLIIQVYGKLQYGSLLLQPVINHREKFWRPIIFSKTTNTFTANQIVIPSYWWLAKNVARIIFSMKTETLILRVTGSTTPNIVLQQSVSKRLIEKLIL